MRAFFSIFTFIVFGFGAFDLRAEIESFDFHSQSPRSLGTAGAYRSIADDQSAFLMNPAGLSRNRENRFLFLGGDFIPSGLSGGDGDFGIRAGVIDGKTEDPLHWGFLFQGIHTDLERRDLYVLGSSFNFQDFFLIGTSSKLINFGTAQNTTDEWAYGLDAGVLVFIHDLISVGFQLQNLISNAEEQNNLDRRYGMGVSLNLRDLRVAVDLERNQTSAQMLIQTGAEYRLSPGFIIRSGYFRNLDSKEHGYSLGTSSQIANRFFVDASYTDQLKSDFSVLGLSFRFRL